MSDRIIRPSMKQIKVWYLLVMLVIVAAVFVAAKYLQPNDERPWLPWLLPGAAALLLLLPIRRHIRQQSMKVTITGDKLRYESGLLSKTTRNIQLSKVQDVRVDQSLGQRMMGIGDLSFETAGGSSRIVMPSIDRPQAAADHILELARAQRAHPDSPAAPDRQHGL